MIICSGNWPPWSSPSLESPRLVRGSDWGDEGNKDLPKAHAFGKLTKKTYKPEAGDVVRPGPPWSAGVRGAGRPWSVVRVGHVREVRRLSLALKDLEEPLDC